MKLLPNWAFAAALAASSMTTAWAQNNANFTRLQTAVETAEAYISGLNPEEYPASALAEYADAVTIAKNMITANSAKQSEVNNMVTALSTAKTKFDKTKGFVFNISDIANSYDTERGFRHPGGLHTQADFDRVKQQLLE